MNINFYENEVKKYTDELVHLKQELDFLQKAGYSDDYTRGELPKDEYLKEEANIKNHIENANAKLEENKKIVNAYKSIISNITSLRSLRATNADYNHPEVQEEVERRNKEIEEARKVLSPEMIKSIEQYFEKLTQNEPSVEKSQSETEEKTKKLDINYFENEAKRYADEVIYLEKELNALYKEGYSDGFTLGGLPKDEYLKEEASIKKHLENAKVKLEENNKIINAYKCIISNMKSLESLRATNADFNHPEVKEEVERRNKEIEEAKKLLPPELIKSIEEMFANEKSKEEEIEIDKEEDKDIEPLFENENKDKPEEKEHTTNHSTETNDFVLVNDLQDNLDKGATSAAASDANVSNQDDQDLAKDEPTNTTAVGFPVKTDVLDIQPEVEIVDVPVNNKGFIPEEENIIDIPIKEEKPIKVAGRKVWNWVKKNKKKILIALGITAITISVIILISQLMPAIAALAQAQQVSALSGAMLNNAASWHGVSTLGQSALHLANEGLANSIATLTGKAAVFNGTTGIWSFAGAELGSLATSASAAVTAEIAKVAAISKTAAMFGAGGLGALGLGLFSNKKKGKVKSEPEPEVVVTQAEPVPETTETQIVPTMQPSIYNEVSAYIDELISYYLAGNEIDMNEMDKLLNYLYSEIEKSPKLNEIEKKILIAKLNNFSEELSTNKGRGM